RLPRLPLFAVRVPRHPLIANPNGFSSRVIVARASCPREQHRRTETFRDGKAAGLHTQRPRPTRPCLPNEFPRPEVQTQRTVFDVQRSPSPFCILPSSFLGGVFYHPIPETSPAI